MRTLTIVGAGPAGLAAATTAAALGLDTLLIDQAHQPGGQIYRGAESGAHTPGRELRESAAHGRALIEKFRQSGAIARFSTSVWQVEPRTGGGFHVYTTQAARSTRFETQFLLVATGARERPMPFPGWELPGVMTAGAGQILLKSAQTVPVDGVVLAGHGPLLYLLANQYLDAGVRPGAIVDTRPALDRARLLRSLPAALASPSLLLRGARLLARIRRHRVPVYRNSRALEAFGDERLAGIKFGSGGVSHQLQTGLLLVHQGVVPDTHFGQLTGAGLRWNASQVCWHVDADACGRAANSGLYFAGDVAGIGGATAAELRGTLSALDIARQLERLTPVAFAAQKRSIERRLVSLDRVRPFLEALYPPQSVTTLADTTRVCRCERVSAGDIRRAANAGCSGPNQLKAFTRCGMGPCQGRLCEDSAIRLLAHAKGESPAQIGYYRARPPLAPVTLGELANLSVSSQSEAL